MKKETPSCQIPLHFGLTQAMLQRRLEDHLGKPVSLVLTQNSTTMLSVRLREGVTHVRLHSMFLNAGAGEMEEICRFVKSKKGEMPLFRKFIRENRDRLEAKPARTISVRTAGRYHDLTDLSSEINRDYFDNAVTAAITWGTRSPRWAVRKRTLGSYSARATLIRINPVLDRKAVPRYYIAFVVYHEMLHAALGIVEKDGRRSMHSKEFRRREKLFADYGRAMKWEGD